MIRSAFPQLEQFVIVHRSCGGLTSDVGELTETGYAVSLSA